MRVLGLKETRQGTQVTTFVVTAEGVFTLQAARELYSAGQLTFDALSKKIRQRVIRKVIGVPNPSSIEEHRDWKPKYGTE